MRAVVQRVSEASVTVEGRIIGEIGKGLLVLVCAMQGDTEANAEKLAARLAKLRIFSDEGGKMNLSIRDVQGSVLAVSQFTLAGDTSRGNRPGFSEAAPPAEGRRLYEHFLKALAAQSLPVQQGEFGADMKVRLLNDGPVTLLMDV